MSNLLVRVPALCRASMSTRKTLLLLGTALVVICTTTIFSNEAFGQSSGNFTYGTGGGTTACVMDNSGNIAAGNLPR